MKYYKTYENYNDDSVDTTNDMVSRFLLNCIIDGKKMKFDEVYDKFKPVHIDFEWNNKFCIAILNKPWKFEYLDVLDLKRPTGIQFLETIYYALYKKESGHGSGVSTLIAYIKSRYYSGKIDDIGEKLKSIDSTNPSYFKLVNKKKELIRTYVKIINHFGDRTARDYLRGVLNSDYFDYLRFYCHMGEEILEHIEKSDTDPKFIIDDLLGKFREIK